MYIHTYVVIGLSGVEKEGEERVRKWNVGREREQLTRLTPKVARKGPKARQRKAKAKESISLTKSLPLEGSLKAENTAQHNDEGGGAAIAKTPLQTRGRADKSSSRRERERERVCLADH